MFWLAQVISVWNCNAPSSCCWAFSGILIRSSPLRIWSGWTSACFPRPTAACSHCTRTVSRIPWGSCGGRPGWANSNQSGPQARDRSTRDFLQYLFLKFFFFFLLRGHEKTFPINASQALPCVSCANTFVRCKMLKNPVKESEGELKKLLNQPNHTVPILSLQLLLPIHRFQKQLISIQSRFFGFLFGVRHWVKFTGREKKRSKIRILDQLKWECNPYFLYKIHQVFLSICSHLVNNTLNSTVDRNNSSLLFSKILW